MTLPPTDPSVPYTKLRETLKTGDIVLMHGTSDAAKMVEKLEKTVGWPPLSHTGMVIRDGDSLYFWDAPGDGACFKDPYANDPANRIYGNPFHLGCRVSPLDEVLAYYATRTDPDGFWIRQLSPTPTAAQFAALRLFINRVDGLLFPGEAHNIELEALALTYTLGQEGGSADFGTYFCAQLVADSYMRMGLLDMAGYPPNGYSPAALAMDDPNRLPLVNAKLSKPVYAIWDLPISKGSPCSS